MKHVGIDCVRKNFVRSYNKKNKMVTTITIWNNDKERRKHQQSGALNRDTTKRTTQILKDHFSCCFLVAYWFVYIFQVC